MAGILSTISLILYITAGLFFACAAAMWFLFKIPEVIGDLSGRNAKKSIEKLRKDNEQKSDRTYRASGANPVHIKAADVKRNSSTDKKDLKPETGILRENQAVSYKTQATGLLDEEATGLLQSEGEATEPLTAYWAEKHTGGIKIKLIEEVILVHSEEVIK